MVQRAPLASVVLFDLLVVSCVSVPSTGSVSDTRAVPPTIASPSLPAETKAPSPTVTRPVLPTATKVIPTATINESDGTLCTWLSQASELRDQRLFDSARVFSWFAEHGLLEPSQDTRTGKFAALTEADYADLDQHMTEYMPHLETFIDQWKKLGPHREAQEAWDIVLEHAEVSLAGLKDMIEASVERDRSKYDRGAEAFYMDGRNLRIKGDFLFAELEARCAE